jgi:hypothetical protein
MNSRICQSNALGQAQTCSVLLRRRGVNTHRGVNMSCPVLGRPAGITMEATQSDPFQPSAWGACATVNVHII